MDCKLEDLPTESFENTTKVDIVFPTSEKYKAKVNIVFPTIIKTKTKTKKINKKINKK